MDQTTPDVDSIVLAALKQSSPEERAAYLDRACGDDVQLRQRVERLLETRQHATAMADTQASEDVPETAAPGRAAETRAGAIEQPGSEIGPYTLLEKLGEGGFGVVYLAEQKAPVERRVALKILKAGMDTGQVLARFEAERQALAMMDHPGIAKVFDAGATEYGRSYFVMELVEGIPITQYCDEHQLTPKQRLELFIQVCQAVQHAHQKGIIHRDLKPPNILVAEYDQRPAAKVIDFGIAKATTQTLTEKTIFTQEGSIIGTFEYMSPEQAETNPLDIDTRSDIYSLGVILYELLTGVTPLGRERLRSAGIEEMLRIIREEEPSRPSTRISALGKLASTPAPLRSRINSLQRFVQGDLDWIVMKSLEKDRARRYESASSFAEDIRRYLVHEPITARPPSAVYRLRKFARRNKTALATTAALLAIVAVMGRTIWTSSRVSTAAVQVYQLLNVDPESLPQALDSLEGHQVWAKADLERRVLEQPQSEDALRARLALTSPDDATHVSALMEPLLSESAHYVAAIQEQLKPHRQRIADDLWKELRDQHADPDRQFRAGVALANYFPDSAEWESDDIKLLAEYAVKQRPADQAVWLKQLRPIARQCFGAWEETFSQGELLDRINVAYAIADVLESRALKRELGQDRFAGLLSTANATQYVALFPLIDRVPIDNLSTELHEIAKQQPSAGMSIEARVQHGKKRAGAAVTLLRLGKVRQSLSALKHKDDPEAVAQFIHRCRSHGVKAEQIWECVQAVSSQDALGRSDGVKLYALLLALSEYPLGEIPAPSRTPMLRQLAQWYAADKRSIVHGATGWLLRVWDQTDVIQQVDQTPIDYSPDREWFIKEIPLTGGARTFLTFVVMQPGEYEIGSPEDEPLRFPIETRHKVRITRPYAIADREVTEQEINAFGEQTGIKIWQAWLPGEKRHAGIGLTWYSSVRFCRWLSTQAGYSEQQQPYPAAESLELNDMKLLAGDDGLRTPRNWPVRLDRSGFRMPTEAEWEVAARSGVRTSFYYGSDLKLLTNYAWLGTNSVGSMHEPKMRKPNLGGLFDAHGNLFEWCHDWRGAYATDQVPSDWAGPPEGALRVIRGGCWGIIPDFCRNSTRGGQWPTMTLPFLGLRVAFTLPSAEAQHTKDVSTSAARHPKNVTSFVNSSLAKTNTDTIAAVER